VGDGLTWLLHLGMSGRVLLVSPDVPAGAHEHVRVDFDRPLALVYRDPRRFGLVRLGRTDELAELAGIGPEPLEPAFTAEVLAELLRATRRDVKAALLDQRL